MTFRITKDVSFNMECSFGNNKTTVSMKMTQQINRMKIWRKLLVKILNNMLKGICKLKTNSMITQNDY